jgi:2-C-methyl-D-erythritol 4-phosphate cytidylyltransferase
MGPDVDKLFLEIHGLPVIAHTWKALDSAPEIHEIILVIRPALEEDFRKLGQSLKLRCPVRFVHGGAERQDSVWNGIKAVDPATRLVAIHDGARPCVSQNIIRRTLEKADQYGAAVACQPVIDTIKATGDGETISQHLDRGLLRAVQTPQCFQLAVIRRAFEAAYAAGKVFTDDTAACQFIGQPVHLVEDPGPNLKITRPDDLPVASLFLEPKV